MRRAMWPALTLRFARQYACSVLSKVSLPQRGPARSAPAVRGRGLSFRRVRLTCGALLVMFLAVGLTGCSCEDANSGAAEARDPVTGLTPAEAREVLVKVGDRSITLGDFVATLLRMDRFERLRYQTEERQKQLLDEMIQVELLAQEAKKRGLDKDPEVTLRMQQALRDELLRQVEAGLPAPEDIVEREVREYYDAHRAEFKEPERRRVLMIRVGTRAVAEEVLEKARGASGAVWGELAKEYHLDRIELKQDGAPELSGDRGFVSAPGEKVGENDSVPDEVRRAIFEVKTIGDVVPRPLEEAGSFFIARLGGISPARDRSVADADRAIRVELRRQKFIEAEKKLEAELRKKYPVVIDEKAIERYQASLPPAPKTPETSPAPVPTPAPEAPAPVAPAPVAPAPSPAPTPAPAAP